MQFTIEEVNEFKKVVNTVCRLSSNKINTPIEQCILVEADQQASTVYFTAMCTGSHKITLEIKADVSTSGKVYILSSKLNSLVNRLNPKVVLTVSISKGSLVFKVSGFGGIQEPLFHDQSGFKPSLINNVSTDEEETFEDVLENNIVLPTLIKTVCSNTLSGASIQMRTQPDKVYLYSKYSESGFIKYESSVSCFSTFDIYLDPNILKVLTSLGDEVNISYNNKNTVIRFYSSKGSLMVIGEKVDSKAYEAADYVLEQPVTGEVIVNHEDIKAVVNWQGYGSSVGQGMTLEMNDPKSDLLIQTDRSASPANLSVQLEDGFAPVTVPLSSFITALKAIGDSKNPVLLVNSVCISQRVLEFQGGEKTTVLSISPADDVDSMATAILYEQRLAYK